MMNWDFAVICFCLGLFAGIVVGHYTEETNRVS